VVAWIDFSLFNGCTTSSSSESDGRISFLFVAALVWVGAFFTSADLEASGFFIL
jgi:hypothetical protein